MKHVPAEAGTVAEPYGDERPCVGMRLPTPDAPRRDLPATVATGDALLRARRRWFARGGRAG
ncbi:MULTISPECIES: hypothetical protein [Burkholderia]|uniref:Uncharacterized protein n=1 Tax=Burkholderia sola TaxID=2843302 RepID=A0ABV2C773_9BURK|nr:MULTISPECIES: hypothetical protein [unclassified Burkholderia]MBP0607021.1 hypothetical protein [Burkholderia sp. CpTa8-5]MBP0714340.1 hypothetical protein [Burkholderia sp. AcTa6-5]